MLKKKQIAKNNQLHNKFVSYSPLTHIRHYETLSTSCAALIYLSSLPLPKYMGTRQRTVDEERRLLQPTRKEQSTDL